MMSTIRVVGPADEVFFICSHVPEFVVHTKTTATGTDCIFVDKSSALEALKIMYSEITLADPQYKATAFSVTRAELEYRNTIARIV